MSSKPIWEQHGISLSDYGKAFNNTLDEAWKRVEARKKEKELKAKGEK